MSHEIKPLKIDIPKEEVESYYRKIKDTRVPTKDVVPSAGHRLWLYHRMGGRAVQFLD